MKKMNEVQKECTKRIKVSSAEILVHGSEEKPYFEIKYRDLSDGKVHVGYSSYNLDLVFEWLEKCFEVLPQIVEQVFGAIEALSAKREEQKWIPCVERFPEDKKTVLICGETGWMETGWREKGCWWTGFSLADIKDDVVAWQPLPEPCCVNCKKGKE